MHNADKEQSTREVCLYVYREGALLTVLSKTDHDYRDIPSWFIKGDFRPEVAERLLVQYFKKVSVTALARIDDESYTCHVSRDSTTVEDASVVFETAHGIRDSSLKFTPRAKLALDSLH